FVIEKITECVISGGRTNEVSVRSLQDRFERQQIRRAVVNHQNVDWFFSSHGSSPCWRLSAAAVRPAFVVYSKQSDAALFGSKGGSNPALPGRLLRPAGRDTRRCRVPGRAATRRKTLLLPLPWPRQC